MMTTNVQILCQDLDHLLKDICDFLSNQINDENLTENQRLFANKLIQRSKKQLQQISKVSVTLSADVDDSSYVDMNKQSAPEVEEPTYEVGEDNEYLTPIDGCASELANNDEPIACPYAMLPAGELEKCEKYGHLDKKGRILFIGHQKRCLAGIRDNWLLLYCTKKDEKPFENHNLMHFKAKPAEGVRTKTFELICSKSQKSFQFVAQTPKDMLQWVACINRKTVGKVEEETRDATDIEEENFYEPLKINDEPDNDSKNKTLKKAKPLPPLPSPNPQNTYIVRRPVPSEESVSDMENYDPICVPDTMKSKPEEENSEEIYDQIVDSVDTKSRRKPLPPDPEPFRPPYLTETRDDSFETAPGEEIYDQIQNVVNPIQNRKPLPPEPEQLRHPQLMEIRRDSSFTNSFSEDEEEVIYDQLVQAPEEDYSNLEEYPQNVEPEEEYCNLVTFQNHNKIAEQPEEEYSNLSLITVEANKRTLPTPPLVQRRNKHIVEEKQEDNEVEEEYDCVVSTSDPISSKDTQSKGRLEPQKLKPKPPVIHPKPQYFRRK